MRSVRLSPERYFDVFTGFSAPWKILKTWNKPGICQTWKKSGKNLEFQLDTWKIYKPVFQALFDVAYCDSRNRKGIINHNIIINSLNSYISVLTSLIMSLCIQVILLLIASTHCCWQFESFLGLT